MGRDNFAATAMEAQADHAGGAAGFLTGGKV